MPIYTIRKYHLGELQEHHTRKRRDAAGMVLCRLTYDAIKASAKLDTKAGRKAMDTCRLAFGHNRATVLIPIGNYQLTFGWSR